MGFGSRVDRSRQGPAGRDKAWALCSDCRRHGRALCAVGRPQVAIQWLIIGCRGHNRAPKGPAGLVAIRTGKLGQGRGRRGPAGPHRWGQSRGGPRSPALPCVPALARPLPACSAARVRWVPGVRRTHSGCACPGGRILPTELIPVCALQLPCILASQSWGIRAVVSETKAPKGAGMKPKTDAGAELVPLPGVNARRAPPCYEQ